MCCVVYSIVSCTAIYFLKIDRASLYMCSKYITVLHVEVCSELTAQNMNEAAVNQRENNCSCAIIIQSLLIEVIE